MVESENIHEFYKLRSLKTYSDDDWLEGQTKKYRYVFEESGLTYISAELSLFNKLFDEKDWDLKGRLKCYDSKGKLLTDQAADKKISKNDNIVNIRLGWGVNTPGTYWKEGTYRWEAWVEDKLAATQYFYIEKQGKVTKDHNPYFELQSLKLYEGPASNIISGSRKYLKQFSSEKTRYIWFELTGKNLVDKEFWACELIYTFRTEAGEVKGIFNEFRFVYKVDNIVSSTGGWGSDSPGSWFPGKYSLEVMFMNTIIASVNFTVRNSEIESEYDDYDMTKNAIKEAEIQTNESPEKESSLKMSADEILNELDSLIGLETIKKRLRDYYDYLKFVMLRKEKGITEDSVPSLHSVFTGNPGTGKTTVALLLGKIYKNLGLLSKGHVVEVDRTDLIGEFIGHTAPKVKEAIKKARGGILFIDEAYSLARSNEDSRDFGREAIEVLLKEMSDGIGDIAIIAAGYPSEIQNFLDSNPGMRSRFSMYFNFPDYIPQELMRIAEYSAKKKNLIISKEAGELMYKKIVEAYRERDKMFGNARFVNSIISEAKMNMGLRIMKSGDITLLSNEEISTIKLPDIEKIFSRNNAISADIPVDEDELHSALSELKKMTGINNIRSEIEETVKLVKYYREAGKDVTKVFSLHSVFTGNPGTGKTTVARILSRIYKALGVLERGTLVECDRETLVGGFVGQTAIKTGNLIEQAMGGVLFIDEAYSLTQGGESDFGKEAIEIILKRMEDRRGEFAVIAAGYPDEMNSFLLSNPGLKSRFDKIYKFDDYDSEEMYQIALTMLKDEDLIPDEEASMHLKEYLKILDEQRDKYFGNAREVRKIIKEAVKNQNLRLADIPRENRTPEIMNRLILKDVEEFRLVKEEKKSFGFTVN
jgi:SpoVK/Ycf46/Vps4 family AAA+-type ATPase